MFMRLLATKIQTGTKLAWITAELLGAQNERRGRDASCDECEVRRRPLFSGRGGKTRCRGSVGASIDRRNLGNFWMHVRGRFKPKHEFYRVRWMRQNYFGFSSLWSAQSEISTPRANLWATASISQSLQLRKNQDHRVNTDTRFR